MTTLDADERAGFGAMDGFDELGGGLEVFAFEVEHLAADHAVDGADGIGDEADDLRGRVGRAVEAGQHFEGAGLQRVAGEDGDGFTEGDVAGGLAAAQVVVVERGQVVVDERVGVKHLDGRAETLDAFGQAARDGDAGLHGEHRPETLAAGKDGVAHGAVDGDRNSVRGGDQLFQRLVGEVGAFLNERFYVGGHCNHVRRERARRRSLAKE